MSAEIESNIRNVYSNLRRLREIANDPEDLSLSLEAVYFLRELQSPSTLPLPTRPVISKVALRLGEGQRFLEGLTWFQALLCEILCQSDGKMSRRELLEETVKCSLRCRGEDISIALQPHRGFVEYDSRSEYTASRKLRILASKGMLSARRQELESTEMKTQTQEQLLEFLKTRPRYLQILKLLAAMPEREFHFTAIEQSLGLNPGGASSMCTILQDYGYVRRHSMGHWKITSAGIDYYDSQ